MEPKGSLRRLQVPATCPYSEPDQARPYPPPYPIPLLEDPSYYYPPIYAWVFQVVSFPQVSPPKPYMHLSSPTGHLILLSLITWIMFGEEYRSLSSSLYGILHFPITSSLLGPNILLCTLFSNSLSLCSSLNMSDQVSNQYKTRSKINVLYVLIFIFLDSKQKTKILHQMIEAFPDFSLLLISTWI